MSAKTDMLAMQEVCIVGESSSRQGTKRTPIALHPGDTSRLVFVTDPTGLAAEQYKMLRRRLCAHHPQGGTLLITSPARGDGKTLTSVNLAWCLAEGGYRTCLVDFDFRAPSVASVLGLRVTEDGIDDVLTGKGTLGQAMLQIGNKSLSVLPVHRSTESPGKLLTGSAISLALCELKTMFHWVVLDLPPAVPTADVAEVLSHADGCLLVIRAHKTDKSSIAGPLELLGSKLWGVVLNDTVVDGSSYYSYYGEHRKSR